MVWEAYLCICIFSKIEIRILIPLIKLLISIRSSNFTLLLSSIRLLIDFMISRKELKKSILLDLEELFVTKVQRELLITRFYIENI